MSSSSYTFQEPSSSSTLELNMQDLTKRKRSLTRDFLTIGIPTLIQLTAEPLAGLVDTAYLGRLGPEVLGGAGVAISAHYAVSKLYNDPLLRTSISLVAASDAQSAAVTASSTVSTVSPHQSDHSDIDDHDDTRAAKERLSVAVSSALFLAAVVGTVQMLVYVVLGQAITRGMGLSTASPMWQSAVSYLHIRSYGTPAATLWLVTNGIFRGLGDTRTPLAYSLLFTALNALLDPLFIFTWQWGASGAAAGTALAQYVALIPLLCALHKNVPIFIPRRRWGALRDSIRQYLKAGGLVLFRSVGKVLAYAVCARQAALLGSVAAAAYNMTFQLGFATTQICEAVAVAVQTLLARELSTLPAATTIATAPPATSAVAQLPGNVYTPQRVQAELVRHLITTSVWLGGGVATALACVTYLRRDWILTGLTTNVEIQAAAGAIFPVVLVTQILKGLAYPVNGIIMGGLDWWSSMMGMWAANLACVGLIRYFALTSTAGLVTLNQLWWALAVFMATQVATGIARYESKTGVWKVLRHEPK
jgi:putative MATE family efflux protein